MVRVAIVGASGYTGAELLRLSLGHPRIEIAGVYARTQAGEQMEDQFPQFAGRFPQKLAAYDAAEVAKSAEVAFLALPHGDAANIARELHGRGLRVFDLSADLRLRSLGDYEAWYGKHSAPELLPRAIYGLVERHRKSIVDARLVAVPGCYPTATLLALAPLLDGKLIESGDIIIDAKSGVSGAGRTPGRATHFPEVAGGVRAYKVAEHRHTPEIEQELSLAHGGPVRVTFTPHLIPMIRGIVSTCYARPTAKRPRAAYLDALRETYRDQPFVAVVDHPPDSAHLTGSNRVHVSAFVDERTGRVIAISAIDNLVKGAAGQAIQCLNVALGFPETEGLDAVGIFP